MARPIKIYWDSCAWLGFLNGEPDKKRELEIVYRHARNGRYELWTSTLSLIEVRFIGDEKGAPRPFEEENAKKISDIFRQPFVMPITLAVDIADTARQIFRTTPQIKWQDSIHLASALRWNVAIMHTYDAQDLIHLSMKFPCRNGEMLPICYPDETTDGPLFAKSGR